MRVFPILLMALILAGPAVAETEAARPYPTYEAMKKALAAAVTATISIGIHTTAENIHLTTNAGIDENLATGSVGVARLKRARIFDTSADAKGGNSQRTITGHQFHKKHEADGRTHEGDS